MLRGIADGKLHRRPSVVRDMFACTCLHTACACSDALGVLHKYVASLLVKHFLNSFCSKSEIHYQLWIQVYISADNIKF